MEHNYLQFLLQLPYPELYAIIKLPAMKKNAILPPKQSMLTTALRIIKDMRVLALLLLLVCGAFLFASLSLTTLRLLMIACFILSLYFHVNRNSQN